MEQHDIPLNRIFLGLGSNLDKEKNMARAGDYLCARFLSLRCSPAVYTSPVGCPGAEPFLNQVAVAYTPFGPDEVRHILKQIETALHRTPADKQNGTIPIDIDLLRWNDQVLKPGDWERPYIVDGIRSLLREEEAEL